MIIIIIFPSEDFCPRINVLMSARKDVRNRNETKGETEMEKKKYLEELLIDAMVRHLKYEFTGITYEEMASIFEIDVNTVLKHLLPREDVATYTSRGEKYCMHISMLYDPHKTRIYPGGVTK